MEKCLTGGEKILGEVVEAVKDFEEKSASGAAAGLKVLAQVVKDISAEVQTCEGVTADWKRLEAMVTAFDSPLSFAYHVGKDLLVNGVQIYGDINDAVAQYNNKAYEPFGEDVGKALALTLLGMEETDKEISTNDNLFLF